MDETLFGWIHLSDIHFGHGDASHGWDQDLVMAALRRDIAGKPAPVRVDAIFVTGDIAFASRFSIGGGRSIVAVSANTSPIGAGPIRAADSSKHDDGRRSLETSRSAQTLCRQI